MDIPPDQFGKRQLHSRPGGLSPRPDAAARPAALDWPGLLARLGAAHDARQSLGFANGPGHAVAGSFAPGVASALVAWRAATPCSPAVNLNAKADGKSPRPIGRSDAGDDRLLARGLP